MITYTHKHLLVIENPQGVRRDVEIFVLPPAPTIQQAQALRVIAERGCNNWLYEFAARTFDLLDMPSAAVAMRRRADHYKRIP